MTSVNKCLQNLLHRNNDVVTFLTIHSARNILPAAHKIYKQVEAFGLNGVGTLNSIRNYTPLSMNAHSIYSGSELCSRHPSSDCVKIYRKHSRVFEPKSIITKKHWVTFAAKMISSSQDYCHAFNEFNKMPET